MVHANLMEFIEFAGEGGYFYFVVGLLNIEEYIQGNGYKSIILS